MKNLIQITPKGMYCEQGGFFIDPIRAVSKAVITHAHSDHARKGHRNYFCSERCAPVLKHRLGLKTGVSWNKFGQSSRINGVKITFYPAGHIIGSSIVRLEYQSQVWVITGDYKLEKDSIALPYEPIKCTHFVTETTFALPVYRWKPGAEVMKDASNWVLANNKSGRISVISAYSLGKAQRIIESLYPLGIPIYVHSSIQQINDLLSDRKWMKAKTQSINEVDPQKNIGGSIVVTPSISSFLDSNFSTYDMEIASFSGWMHLRKSNRWGNVDRGFVLSDHVDWEGINRAVKESSAEYIYTTHGFSNQFAKWLCSKGYNAMEFKAT